jgi:hypothetical protein
MPEFGVWSRGGSDAKGWDTFLWLLLCSQLPFAIPKITGTMSHVCARSLCLSASKLPPGLCMHNSRASLRYQTLLSFYMLCARAWFAYSPFWHPHYLLHPSSCRYKIILLSLPSLLYQSLHPARVLPKSGHGQFMAGLLSPFSSKQRSDNDMSFAGLSFSKEYEESKMFVSVQEVDTKATTSSLCLGLLFGVVLEREC